MTGLAICIVILIFAAIFDLLMRVASSVFNGAN